VSQLLYSGGQVRSALEIARLTRDNSWFSLVETVNEVISVVKQEYFNIILTKELIRVEEESVALLEQELRDQKNRLEAGTVPQFNVLRAEVELSNAKPGLITAKNNYRISQLRLARTLGADTRKSGIGTDQVLYVPTTEMIYTPYEYELDPALAIARQRRALLKQRRQDILIESEQVKAELGGYLPTLTAAGGYEIRSSNFDSSWDESLEGWFAGVEGSWNIFDGLETAGKVSQARARLAKSKIAYEDSVRQVDIEVQEAYSRLREAQELIESQTKTVEQAREALRLSQARFSAGAGTQLEVFDSRVALNSAQVTELQARYNFIVAVAEIDRVTSRAFEYQSSFEDPLLKERWVKRLMVEEPTTDVAPSTGPETPSGK
jgi:outer membrane protein TolC